MADPINHDAASGLATAGGEAVKGSLIGGAVAIGGGALLGAAVFALGGFLLGIGGLVGVGALLGAGVGLIGGAAPMAVIGGFFGFAKGGNKVSREKEAFRDRVRSAGHVQQQGAGTYNTGEISGVQQGYQIGRMEGEQAGFQKGAQYGAQAVVAQIHQHVASQQIEAQAHSQPGVSAVSEATAGGGFAEKVASCKCESRVEMVDKQRQAAAAASAAGTQVG